MKTSTTLISKLAVLGVIAAALGLAACGGYGSNDGGGSGNGQAARTVSNESINGMNVLVDSHGRALYSPDQERTGKITCMDGCIAIWKPLTASGHVSAAAGLNADINVIKRPDKGRQVTFKGRPLYSFTEEGPGELTGDNFKDAFGGKSFTWHAVTASGNATQAPAQSPTRGY